MNAQLGRPEIKLWQSKPSLPPRKQTSIPPRGWTGAPYFGAPLQRELLGGSRPLSSPRLPFPLECLPRNAHPAVSPRRQLLYGSIAWLVRAPSLSPSHSAARAHVAEQNGGVRRRTLPAQSLALQQRLSVFRSQSPPADPPSLRARSPLAALTVMATFSTRPTTGR
jgi:hypothetical protein